VGTSLATSSRPMKRLAERGRGWKLATDAQAGCFTVAVRGGLRRLVVAGLAIVASSAWPACSGSTSGLPGGVGQAGQSCSVASQCYAALDAGAVHGQVTCLTQLQNGYCTHTCQSDADCCAAAGECPTSLEQVCASFESSGKLYCVLRCDAAYLATVPAAGASDPAAYCQRWANAAFTCRSTGGGSGNRKFCGP